MLFTVADRCWRLLAVCTLLCIGSWLGAQQPDSIPALEKVTVTGIKNKNSYTAVAPTQQLDKELLQQLNSFSVGDAARYFSGALVRDYGGVGGLKTISVRSLGASQTGIMYDGVPVSNAQSGQVDLSRFSVSFLQRVSLQDGDNFALLVPARSYASAALLSVNTIASFPLLIKKQWQVGLRNGSFGVWQPFAGITFKTGKTFITASAELTKATGDYGFTATNGMVTEKAARENSDIKSLNAEINSTTVFKDSATWKNKAAVFTSERGLPGGIIFFNDHSAQRLWNTDAFLQSIYEKAFGKLSVLTAVKYNYSYTRYLDPDYLNNDGRLDDAYRQHEGYISAALAYRINKPLTVSLAADMALTNLTSNRKQFARPERLASWVNAAIQYEANLWKLHVSLLHNYAHDKVKTGNASGDQSEFTPAAAFSIKPAMESPFLFRVFYKRIFRLPTFNDLYYTLAGNNKLKPEFTSQYNAGIVYSRYFAAVVSEVNLSADAYYNTITDKIIAIPNKNLFVWSMLNLGKVQVKGIDVNAELRGRFSKNWKWFVKTAYTFQQAVDVSNKNAGSYKDQIAYTPEHSGSAVCQLQYNNWSLGYNSIFSGSRYSLGDNNPSTYLPGWSTHDLALGKDFYTKACKVTARAELNNVFDKRYDIIRYFPMQGRSYRISLIISKI